MVHKRIGGILGRQIIDELGVFEVTVGFAALASAASVTLLDTVDKGETWKVRNIEIVKGTNFDAGGDRLLDVTDGSTIWTSIPVATLKTLAYGRWGDASGNVPDAATPGDRIVASAALTDIVAKYSGGATDYVAGSVTIVLTAERTM